MHVITKDCSVIGLFQMSGGLSEYSTGWVMLFSAGTFLYVSTVHVLPEISHEVLNCNFPTLSITFSQFTALWLPCRLERYDFDVDCCSRLFYFNQYLKKTQILSALVTNSGHMLSLMCVTMPILHCGWDPDHFDWDSFSYY